MLCWPAPAMCQHRDLCCLMAAAEARAGHQGARRQRCGPDDSDVSDKHSHGMDEMSFNALFTEKAPVIFAFHNNRWLIHTLVHGRSNEARFHVHGYMDYGTTTTPFDMVVLNEMSRFHLLWMR